MKQLYSLVIVLLISVISTAQTEQYEFALQYIGVNGSTGNYQFALVATPDADVTAQLSADMAAMISVPTGYTIGNFENGTSGIAASEFISDDYSVASDAGDPAFYVNRQVPTTNIDFNFTSGTPIQLVRFDVIGTGLPNSGFITLVPPGDSSRLGFLEDYINMTDGGGTTTNRYGSKSTTNNTFNFASLGTVSNELESVGVYPNPVKNELNITGFNNELTEISVFTITGQKVLTQNKNFEKVNMANLAKGVYFVNLTSQTSEKTIKIVKQ